jgi:hypothetical protein
VVWFPAAGTKTINIFGLQQFFLLFRYCNNRVAVYDLEGHYLREMKGDWDIVHSLQLFEDEVMRKNPPNFFCRYNDDI